MNIDINSNYHLDLGKRLEKLKIPYSRIYRDFNSNTTKISFYNYKDEIIVYQDIKEDIFSRELRRLLNK